jgi:hypothetical protein
LAVDVSHSLDEEETRLQREGYHAALADAAVRGGAHDVAYVEWAGPSFQRLLVPWTRVAGRTDAEALVTRLAVAAAAAPSSHYFSSTAIAHGIVFSVVTLEEAPWEAARRVIDLSGDGVDNGGWTVPVEGARA